MEMDDKWTKPGWRIEQKYSNKVLIGNWAEDKLQFTRDCCVPTSTHRLDYRPQRDHRPDVFVRREALRRAEGLPTKLLLDHHGTPHSHYLVSLYDETYGRKSTSTPPTLRSWHPDKLAWVPERSDHPVEVPPTNFGLAESRLARSGRPAAHHMLSEYRSTFSGHPASAFSLSHHTRTPRTLSSHLHPNNRTNKDLGLKHRPLLQVPDHPACLLPHVATPQRHRSTPRDSPWTAQHL
ncbi:hypothetical protein AAFF_G00096340 [Aldrovandia affinis]|uniref:Uncharacterized protein n=1 Tax=Aldrovandia affinis TaxID=143900 RepID=A0AAD7RVV7_9TELE|nr:hypothetical protein AAFF_G00096340 [Aldrovandia affinis]